MSRKVRTGTRLPNGAIVLEEIEGVILAKNDTGSLTIEERQFLEAILSHFRASVVDQRETGAMKKKYAQILFDKINALSDKIMPEEEAARILQDMGFEIVEKPHG